MIDNLNPLSKARPSPHGKAFLAWHGDAPDWVLALAEKVDQRNGREAGRLIGYSAAVVSQVLGNIYKGDLRTVEGRVRGALLGDEVTCPVAGDIRRDRCLSEQKKTHTGTSAQRTRLFHACRSGCPHSRLKGGGDAS